MVAPAVTVPCVSPDGISFAADGTMLVSKFPAGDSRVMRFNPQTGAFIENVVDEPGLVGARADLGNFRPSVLDHYTLWNVERLFFADERSKAGLGAGTRGPQPVRSQSAQPRELQRTRDRRGNRQ